MMIFIYFVREQALDYFSDQRKTGWTGMCEEIHGNIKGKIRMLETSQANHANYILITSYWELLTIIMAEC